MQSKLKEKNINFVIYVGKVTTIMLKLIVECPFLVTHSHSHLQTQIRNVLVSRCHISIHFHLRFSNFFVFVFERRKKNVIFRRRRRKTRARHFRRSFLWSKWKKKVSSFVHLRKRIHQHVIFDIFSCFYLPKNKSKNESDSESTTFGFWKLNIRIFGLVVRASPIQAVLVCQCCMK